MLDPVADVHSKLCRSCGEVKPLTEFYVVHKGSEKRMTKCKACNTQYAKENKTRANELQRLRYEADPARSAAHHRKYRLTHRESLAAYVVENRERSNELQNQRYQQDPEKKKAHIKVYRRNHPEKAAETARLSHQAHKEARYRTMGRWHKAHPEYQQQLSQRRRALKRQVLVDLTAAQWDAIKKKYDYKCAYWHLPFEALTMDHVVPLSKLGNHTAENIVPACKPCNSRKGNRPPPCPVRTYKPEELL